MSSDQAVVPGSLHVEREKHQRLARAELTIGQRA